MLRASKKEILFSLTTMPIKYKALHRFYCSYKWASCTYSCFYKRVIRSKIPMEEAILPHHRPQPPVKVRTSAPYLKTWKKKKNIKPTSFIDVTLAPEEASVFRKEYEHILSKLEHDLAFCTHPSDMGGISKKIAKLKEEIKVFNHYN